MPKLSNGERGGSFSYNLASDLRELNVGDNTFRIVAQTSDDAITYDSGIQPLLVDISGAGASQVVIS